MSRPFPFDAPTLFDPLSLAGFLSPDESRRLFGQLSSAIRKAVPTAVLERALVAFPTSFAQFSRSSDHAEYSHCRRLELHSTDDWTFFFDFPENSHRIYSMKIFSTRSLKLRSESHDGKIVEFISSGALSQFRRLENLSISPDTIPDLASICSSLMDLPCLRVFSIEFNTNLSEKLEAAMKIINPALKGLEGKCLETLRFTSNRNLISEVASEGLVDSLDSLSLRHLELMEFGGLGLLEKLAQSKQNGGQAALKRLSAINCRADFRALAQFAVSGLEELKIDGSAFIVSTVEGWEEFLEAIKSPSCSLRIVDGLNLAMTAHGQFSGATEPLVEALANNRSIKEIEFDPICELADHPAYGKFSVFNRTIEKLAVGREFPADCLANFLSENSVLTQLRFAGKFPETGFQAGKFATALKKLKVEPNQLTEASTKALSIVAISAAPLRILALPLNKLCDSGILAIIQALTKAGNHLEQLDLGQCDFGEKGGLAIASWLGSDSGKLMKTMDLMGNSIGDAAGVRIAEALATHSQLNSLSLSRCDFGGKAGLAFAHSLQRNISLIECDLSENSGLLGRSGLFGKPVCEELGSALRENSSLRRLMVRQVKAAVKEISKLLALSQPWQTIGWGESGFSVKEKESLQSLTKRD